MALTPAYRAHLRAQWRQLAQESLAGGGATVARCGPDLINWPSPSDDTADQLALYALARMAMSHARARSQTAKAARAPALTALALLALEILGEDPPPPEPPGPPTLPFRADLDG